MYLRILKELVGFLAAILIFIAIFMVFAPTFGAYEQIDTYKNTTDVSEKDAKDFYIALVKLDNTSGKDKYIIRSLYDIELNPPDLSVYSYILPDTDSIVRSKGDKYKFKVFGEQSDNQLIHLYYGKASWSMYRAFHDKIVPVARKYDPGLAIIIPTVVIIAGIFIALQCQRWIKRKFGILE